jgi:hydrogenase assembly chaperone HypC/HupF
VTDSLAPVCNVDDHHCVTCGDDGVPMRVVKVDDTRGLALCAGADGARQTVEIMLVAPVTPGDELLVHAGTAIACLERAA